MFMMIIEFFVKKEDVMYVRLILSDFEKELNDK